MQIFIMHVFYSDPSKEMIYIQTSKQAK